MRSLLVKKTPLLIRIITTGIGTLLLGMLLISQAFTGHRIETQFHDKSDALALSIPQVEQAFALEKTTIAQVRAEEAKRTDIKCMTREGLTHYVVQLDYDLKLLAKATQQSEAKLATLKHLAPGCHLQIGD